MAATGGFGEGTINDEDAQKALLEKFKDTQHFLNFKDPKLPPPQMLDVDERQLNNAKDAELLKPVRVRFMEDGPDRTIDSKTEFSKAIEITGVSGQETILDLRRKIAAAEKMPIEDVNLYCAETNLEDKTVLTECYADWMGFGLEDWPPRFIVKPSLKGFEIHVNARPGRDFAEWDKGRLLNYASSHMVFDVLPSTKVKELKDCVAVRTRLPASRCLLTAHLRKSLNSLGEWEELSDDNKTMADYELDKYCVCVQLEKRQFDENGDYIFDDAFWDEQGYHSQPAGCIIAQDSLSDRARPDANSIDPNLPLSIVSDRRAAERN